MDIDRHHACLAMPVSLIYREFGVEIASRMARTLINLTHWVATRIRLRRGPGRTRELVDADLLLPFDVVSEKGVTHCRSRNIYSGTFP